MPHGPDILEDFAVQSSHSIGFWFSINRAIADMGVGVGYFGLKFCLGEFSFPPGASDRVVDSGSTTKRDRVGLTLGCGPILVKGERSQIHLEQILSPNPGKVSTTF